MTKTIDNKITRSLYVKFGNYNAVDDEMETLRLVLIQIKI